MQYESAVFHCGKPRFAVYWFRAVLLTSIPSRLCYSTSTYRSREIQKEERFPPNRRCGSVETCRKAARSGGCEVLHRGGGRTAVHDYGRGHSEKCPKGLPQHRKQEEKEEGRGRRKEEQSGDHRRRRRRRAGLQYRRGRQGVHRARRPERLRQVDHAAHDRRSRGDQRRRALHRRQADERCRAQRPRHRDGLPELCALSAHDRL